MHRAPPHSACLTALAVGLVTTLVLGTGRADDRSSPGWSRGFASIWFAGPRGIAVDREGNLFISDLDAATVHKLTPRGEVVLLPGGASIVDPVGLGTDRGGNVWVADVRRADVFKIAPDGRTTLAAVATLDEPRFSRPSGVAIDRAGHAFVADPGDGTIRRIAADGALTTFAGIHDNFGDTDGPARAARFRSPRAVAVDRLGALYVADDRSHTIRKISASGYVSTLAGEAGTPGSADGDGRDARFRGPKGLAADGAGNLYVADTENSTIRQISFTGEVTTLAGKAGETGDADGQGAKARFRKPEAIAADEIGNVFVADTGNRTIRQISPDGYVSTIVGRR